MSSASRSAVSYPVKRRRLVVSILSPLSPLQCLLMFRSPRPRLENRIANAFHPLSPFTSLSASKLGNVQALKS